MKEQSPKRYCWQSIWIGYLIFSSWFYKLFFECLVLPLEVDTEFKTTGDSTLREGNFKVKTTLGFWVLREEYVIKTERETYKTSHDNLRWPSGLGLGLPCWRSEVWYPLPAKARGLPFGLSSSHRDCLLWVTSPVWFVSYCIGAGVLLCAHLKGSGCGFPLSSKKKIIVINSLKAGRGAFTGIHLKLENDWFHCGSSLFKK